MIIYAGDSWASRGFTEENYKKFSNSDMPGDVRLTHSWGLYTKNIIRGGMGNLDILDAVITADLSPKDCIIWIYTEPGRDYKRITGSDEFGWITSEDTFELRTTLDREILTRIKVTLPNPIALIGGLSDVDTVLAESLGFKVLHPSWQGWIADTLNRRQYFNFGWGASDVGWRADYNNVKPSKAALFAWDKLIKEWCMWEELGYMCHEHPTPRANDEFGSYLKQHVIDWIDSVKK